jgi:hypothetical protein
MKQKRFLIIMLVIFILSACNNLQNIETTSSTSNEITATSMFTPFVTPTPSPKMDNTKEEDYDYPYPTPTDNHRNADGSISKNFLDVKYEYIDDTIRYINKELGYSLDFPDYWEDYLLISGYINSDEVSFYFFGKSIIGQGYYMNFEPMDGIYLFSIIPEEEIDSEDFMDVLGFVGIANDVRYFAVASLDVPMDILDGEYERLSNNKGIYQGNEIQTELIKNDIKSAWEMQDDIDDVMETFKAIEP